MWVARGLKQAPFAETTARLEPIGVPGGETADVGGIYVTTIDTPTPGKYWFLAEPVGGRKIQALGNVVVAQEEPPHRPSATGRSPRRRRRSPRRAATSRR